MNTKQGTWDAASNAAEEVFDSTTPKPRAGEHTKDADPGEPDEAWMHAACLTIAETGQKWGESVHPSLAMQAVFKLRTERDSLAAQNRELREALHGMLSIEDAVTQGQESERRAEWRPKARALLAKHAR